MKSFTNGNYKIILLMSLLIQVFLIGVIRANQLTWRELVNEAKNYDPVYTQSAESADRNKAISLYGQAITKEPSNPENIKVKHRIAQLYACYSDPDRGIHPNLFAGMTIFNDIINHYPITQIDCLQSHIGLGCAYLIQGNPDQANFYYKRVLDFEPENYLTTKKNLSEQEFEGYLEKVTSVRLTSVDTIAKASYRIGPEYFFDQMNYIVNKYPNTPLAERAIEHTQKAAKYLSNIDNIINKSIEDLDSLDTTSHTQHDDFSLNATVMPASLSEENKQNFSNDVLKNKTKTIENTIAVSEITPSENISSENNPVQNSDSSFFHIFILLAIFMLVVIGLFLKYFFSKRTQY